MNEVSEVFNSLKIQVNICNTIKVHTSYNINAKLYFEDMLYGNLFGALQKLVHKTSFS